MYTILLVLLGIAVIYTIFYCITNKVRIKWKTFKERGFAPKRGNFGIYCYDGKQGKGKTYSLVEYLLDNKDDIVVFCNIADIQNLRYTYYTGFKQLLQIKKMIDDEIIKTDQQIVIVYDEIFTELQKQSKLNAEVMDFLCQMRKRQIIFMTTAQEWSEIPLTFRRFCRYQIKCNMINIFGIGILIKQFKDAENMKWSNDEQEHIAPLMETTITKCRKRIANSYNTFLRIRPVLNTQDPNISQDDDNKIKIKINI